MKTVYIVRPESETPEPMILVRETKNYIVYRGKTYDGRRPLCRLKKLTLDYTVHESLYEAKKYLWEKSISNLVEEAK